MRPVPPSAKWVAWRRSGRGRWYVVGGSDTEAGAWQMIYAAMDAAPRSGAFSSCVLPAGVKP